MMVTEKQLRVLRARSRVTQHALTAALGISQSRLSRLENGQTRFTPDEQARVTAFFAALKPRRKAANGTGAMACTEEVTARG